MIRRTENGKRNNGKAEAILLVGPTGSGKTPLGEMIQRKGFCGRKVYHFDFGEHLRKAAASKKPIYGLSAAETTLIRKLLKENKLLPDSSLGIAAKILSGFVSGCSLSTVHGQPARSAAKTAPERCSSAKAGLVLLNGYPRNVRQAKMVDGIVDMKAVIQLDCSKTVVLERIKRDTGGDRAGRSDDSKAEIFKKLDIYSKATLPVLDYYKRRKVLLLPIKVGISSTSLNIYDAVERKVRICL